WDALVLDLEGNPLQLWGWGEVKAKHGWRAVRLRVRDGERVVGCAQVLVRPLPGVFGALSHVPRGPVVRTRESRGPVCDAVAEHCRREIKGVGITFEPDWPADDDDTITGGVPSPNPIFMASTLVLDLAQDDDTLLARMAKKTPHEVRKSQRREGDITDVRTAEDLDAGPAPYRETSERAGFGIHADAYYRDVHAELGDRSVLLLARDEGTPVAFLWIAASDRTGIDLYGGSNDAGRKLLANYALKWRAIHTLRDR